MAKISLDYEECKFVISSLDNAINDAKDDQSSLKRAFYLASCCYGGAAANISTAISEIENAIEDLEVFKIKFNNIVTDIKEYDRRFQIGLNSLEAFENSEVSGALDDVNPSVDCFWGLYNPVSDELLTKCYIELMSTGKYRVIGTMMKNTSTTYNLETDGLDASEADYNIGNVTKGTSHWAGTKIAANVATNAGKDIGGMAVATACAEAGAAIGTAIPVPGVGTAAGAAIGFVSGYAGAKVYNYFVGEKKYNGYTAAEWINKGIENGLYSTGEALASAKDAVGDFFSGSCKLAFG